MSFPDFAFFGATIDTSRREFLKGGIDQFRIFIIQQATIRCFIPGGPNYGHYSAPVNIIRRFCGDQYDTPPGYDYRGTIEIYVNDNDDIPKIFELLPELGNKQAGGKLGQATINIINLMDKPPSTEIAFGFAGACDYINGLPDVSFLETDFLPLKVKSFLMLQPYKWKVKAYAQHGLDPGNIIFYKKVEMDSTNVYALNLESGKTILCREGSSYPYTDKGNLGWLPPLHVADRSFALTIQDLNDTDWTNIIAVAKTEDDKALLRMLQGFTTGTKVTDFGIVPIYGVIYDSTKEVESFFRKPASDRLALALASVHTALRDGATTKIKRPVLFNFSAYKAGSNAAMSMKKVTNIANGGRTANEEVLRAITSPDSTQRQLQIAADLTYTNRRNAFNTEPEIVVKAVEFSEANESLEQLLTWLKGSATRVLLIQAGRVPSNVFNYLLSVTGQLPIFEGQNTAVPAITTGKPYIHTEGYTAIGTANNYAPGNVGDNDASALIARIQNAANQIQANLDTWPASVAQQPNNILSTFINSIDTDEVKNYFGSVQEFFQKSFNDKIVIGSSTFINIYKTVFTSQGKSIAANEPSPLEKLFNDIKAAIAGSGKVDLLGVIFPSGGINKTFKSLVAPTGGQLIITDPAVTSRNNEAGQIEAVILKGNSNAYGIDTTATLNFTVQYEEMTCDATFTGKDEWSMDGIPWIVFTSPTFHVTASNGDMPPGGYISVILKDTDLTLKLSLPDAQGLATGSGTFDKPASISTFLGFVGGINLENYVPEAVQKLANIGVKAISFTYNSNLKIIDSVSVRIGSPDKWPLISNLAIDNADVLITIIAPGDLKNRKISAAMRGELLIGTGDNPPRIAVGAQIPALRFSGDLISPQLPLTNLLQIFWPGASPSWPDNTEPAITALAISYDTNNGAYTIDTTLQLDWPIVILGRTVLTIEYLSLALNGNNSSHTGSLVGSIVILPKGANIGMLLTANYLGKGNGWKFMAQQTSGVIKLVDFMRDYLQWEITKEFDINIDGLGIEIETATNSWLFTAKTADPIKIPGVDLSLDLNLKLGYNGGTKSFGGVETIHGKAQVPVITHQQRVVSLASLLQADPPVTGYFGTGQADIIWQNISLTVYYNFDPKVKKFGIKWGPLEGEIITTTNPDKTTATLRFTQSTTIGSMVETMVEWATGSKFSLGAPWNILDSIALNNLVLTFNFTDKQVGLQIDLNPINIGLFGINIATITGFKLSYNSDQPDPNQNGVQVQLLGSFLWQQDKSKPLGWDASKPETTPAPPAQGNKYLDLRMLALGQHVDVQGLSSATSISQAITIMEKLPDTPKGKVPPVKLSANSGWLTGMDFGLVRISEDPPPKASGQGVMALASDYVFNLQVVFADPKLYGLRIALNGDAAKVLKGLQFEIMYRQISQSVGVYQSEITLPDIMRNIRLGQFNITLPVFGIQVYTNGDFQVDLGFPWNTDFSRAFTLQTIIFVPAPIPVMGSIGLYFAKLSSATTTKVPASKKGLFNPVVAFGVGFQIGVGYEFNLGILSAGFSLTVAAIIEGVLAKWNPYLPATSSQRDRIETDYYFSIRGTVGLIGKLYGTVDFAIIKASVNIEISITAQFYFAPYEPVELALTAKVTASASIKILFISISFSFSLRIQHHLTLPAVGGTAPWADGTQQLSLAQLRRHERAGMAVKLLQHRLLAANLTFNWDNLQPAATPAELTAYLALGITAARDENEQSPTLAAQQACAVAMLMMESVKAPQDDQHSSRLKALKTVADSAFEQVAKQVFRWVIAALQPNPVTAAEVDQLIVTRETLETALAYLSSAENPIPVPEKDILTFMERQFKVVVHKPEGNNDDNELSATYFPMLPSIGFSIQRSGDPEPLAYTYAAYNATSTDYLAALRVYFNELAVEKAGKNTAYKAFRLSDDDGPSIGSFIFADYYALLAKQMLEMASNSLKRFVYPIQKDQTTGDIIKWVNDTGKLSNGADYTLEKLFEDNKAHTLTTDSSITINGSSYVVQTGDNFSSIAALALYGSAFTARSLALQNQQNGDILKAGLSVTYDTQPAYTILPQQSLENIAKHFGQTVTVEELLDKSNILTLKDLLLPATTLQLPEFVYKTKDKDNLNEVSTKFGVTMAQLSAIAANLTIKNLFATTEEADLDIVQLPQFNVGALIQEIQFTQGLQHLSGLTSRYYMAGLRLPTKGLSPKFAGMWVTEDKDGYKLPDAAGLFALTGQQFQVPVLTTGKSIALTFSNNGSKWISFDNQPKLDITITPTSVQYQEAVALTAFATKNYLDVDLVSLGVPPLYTIEPNNYTFNSDITWASPAAINMPYAGTAGDQQQLRLWKIPDALLQVPDPNTHQLNPYMTLQLGTYDEATQQMHEAPFNGYGWATRIDFTIRRIVPVPGSPNSASTYEVGGADGFNTLLLEKLVNQVGANDTWIDSLHIAYAQSSDSTAGGGIQTDNPDELTIGLAQVNLTTVTAPHVGADSRNQLAGSQHLVTPTTFIRLLWEASITSQGGYYLYYNNSISGAGLPDRIFDNQGTAFVSLIVVFSNANRNQLFSYMNTLVTAPAVDFTAHTLFAKTLMQHVEIKADANTSLAGIAQDFFADIDQVADENKDVPLRTGATLTLTGGVYMVGTQAPGGLLNDIATWFEVTSASLKQANPQVTNWDNPLEVYTALYIPDHQLVVGTGKGGNTLASIGAYYGISLSGLAVANRQVSGLFELTKPVTFKSGPLSSQSTVKQNEMAIKAVRKVPAAVPAKPGDKDFALIFLQNNFSLLGYHVADNAFFRQSHISMPVCPVIPEGKTSSNKKFAVPGATDVWQYTDSLGYITLLKEVKQNQLGAPDNKNNPYQGLGDLLQIHYSWQDLYGNSLLTTLDNSQDNKHPNNAPVLIKYNDTLIGLSRWPAVSTNWQVVKTGTQPALNVLLNFDAASYDGLLKVEVVNNTTLTAVFTNLLDETAATNKANYKFSPEVEVDMITLNADKQSVQLSVKNLPEGIDISLQVKDILSADKKKSYEGAASFSTNTAIPATSNIISKAAGDKALYEQIWYQLNDKNGIGLSVSTSLLPNRELALDPDQTKALVQTWIEAIYQYLDNRAAGKATGDVPALQHIITFNIDPATVETKDIFQLTLNFIIGRRQLALAENSNEAILVARTAIAPLSDLAAGNGNNYTKFVNDFEAAFAGSLELRVAAGVDRFDSAVTAGSVLWVTRLSTSATAAVPSLGYAINQDAGAKLFAPRPVANQLISRTNVPIAPFDSSSAPVNRDFIDVDINLWCRQVFENFDELLSPAFVTSIQIIDLKNKAVSPGATNYFEKLIGQKEAFANILKDLMVPVFASEEGLDPKNIREDFRQALLVQLSNAYSVQSGLEFTADVFENNLNEPAFLYGNVEQVVGENEQPIPNLQFTAPKINLAPDKQAGVRFLLSSPQIIKGTGGEVLSRLDLQLAYTASSIEHQIGELPGIKDYKASSWLQFFSKNSSILASQQLSKLPVQVPLPLNVFPPVPGMTRQNGELSSSGSTAPLADLLDWNYLFSYSQAFHYPQDILHFSVRFNLVTGEVNKLTGLPDAFNALAQFISVVPAINEALDKLQLITMSSTPQEVAAATATLKAYTDLTGNIIKQAGNQGLQVKQFDPRNITSVEGPYNFEVKEGIGTNGELVISVGVTADVIQAIGVPVVDLEGYTRNDYTAEPHSYYYTNAAGPLKAAVGQTIPGRTVKLKNLNILGRQDAAVSVYLDRNAELVPGKPTNNAFVYTTGSVEFPNYYYPNFARTEEINIATITGKPVKADLQTQLNNLFDALLVKNKQSKLSFSVVGTYHYQVNPAGNTIQLPVMMQPGKTFDLGQHPDKAPAGMIANWVKVIDQWLKDYNPGTANAALNFNLTIFSNLTDEPKPLIQLTSLYLNMVDIV
ncbi:hypothetical protein SAMN05444266_103162 [Chitinophaga jiangningensis]|uniref:LysM domain-containing protein n=1 Tax=Chitinophaga jiangningensis TaxID=1419482 RepID=A0A1M7A827_9BACT|nr:hypothetical protein [Chitinophaga jiangningensis]SHL38756.1 hypothetical protein SAMN05444266_103162 [Chitinophaga jiangningensis]